MSRNLSFSFICIATIALASTSAAQVPTGGRGGVPKAAGGTATRGELANPRVALEAAEARFREINEAEFKQPPQRDYKVEMGEPQKTKLFRADPKLFENKFVAQVILGARDQSKPDFRGNDPRSASGFAKEMVDRIALENGSHGRRSFLKLLAEYCPADQRPDAQLAFLTSAEFDRDVRGMLDGHGFTFTVYAPTADEAKDRAAAIVRLYDCGACRPLQQYFLIEGRKRLAAARAKCDEYDKLSEEIRVEEEKINQPSEVSTDILSQLKAQRVMVAVELAGLSARVKACDQMLNEPKRLEVSTLQSISDMKVKAEIERIGTQEKLDRINTFIAEGDRREAIQKSISKLNARLQAVRREASNPISEAESHAQLIEHYAPRELEGNAIVISPVEWTE
jgi:hypothetical protein